MPGPPQPALDALQRANLSPEMQQGLELARRERPDIGDVDTYGPISRRYAGEPGNQGYTSPGRTIYLNPDVQQTGARSPEQWADTLIHEQTHVDQMNKAGGGMLGELWRQVSSPQGWYGQRPREMEAFQVEQQRQARQGRPFEERPSFDKPGQYYTPHDINLPNPTPRTDALRRATR